MTDYKAFIESKRIIPQALGRQVDLDEINHWWSKKHMHRYAAECAFRLSTKSLPALSVTETSCGINFVRVVVAGMEGRRLTYKELIS